MYHLIVFIVDDINQCQDILDAWETAGARGITILDSTGLGRIRKKGIRDDLPLMPSLSNIFRTEEERHRTLLSVVEGQAKVDAVVQATESVVGDLSKENTGFLFVVPVSQVYGISNNSSESTEEK